MIERIKSIIKYFLYWLFFFQVGRVLFFIFTAEQSSKFSFRVITESMLRGIWLDASVAGYFTLFLCLVLIIELFKPVLSGRILTVFHSIFLVIACLAMISNMVLYTFWSVPIDMGALKYLENPGEAAASVNWLKMILPLLSGAVLFWLFQKLFFYSDFMPFRTGRKSSSSILKKCLLLIVLGGLCIIPMRGGTGIVPVNLSFVYFHNNIYPNHAAYNPIWNILFSWSESGSQPRYSYMNDKLADEKFKTLHQIPDSSLVREIWLNKRKPNVIVIVLESFLSKLVGLKYKGEEVVPYFNKLCKEGIYFSNMYSSGDRSDKGLASIFSGFPAMPKSSLLQFPEKLISVPSIFKDVSRAGYSTAFFYGGNLDFANLKSYFMLSGVNEIISGNEVSKRYDRGKWGVHDEFMFKEVFRATKGMVQPFFTGFFTLSNHEPYDLPEVYHFGNRNSDEEYMSSARYTDKWLRRFTESLRQTAIWENTLIVLVADHGVTRLGIHEAFDPAKYHIPMVWTGGVVQSPKIISKITSQTDIPPLLIHQMGIKSKQNYKYSNRLSDSASRSFATYFYNDGVGIVTENCTAIFDNVIKRYHAKFCRNNDIGTYGKAYLQVLSREYAK